MNDVARCIEARYAGPLVAVAEEAAVLCELRTDHLAEARVCVRTERGVDAVEGVMPFGGVDDDAIARNRDRLRRSVDASDAGILQLGIILGLEPQRLVGRDQRHVRG